MESRTERLKALLKQKADIQNELDAIAAQMKEEKAIIASSRKPRKSGQPRLAVAGEAQ
jgi:hypothetical protein